MQIIWTAKSLIGISAPFHKGKKASVPRFNVNPKSVASFSSGSPDYLRCRLEGYPSKTRYPESASELQQWISWDATSYVSSSPQDDDVVQEVAGIADSLVFQLTSAFLVGSEHQGAAVMLGFQEYRYRKSPISSLLYSVS